MSSYQDELIHTSEHGIKRRFRAFKHKDIFIHDIPSYHPKGAESGEIQVTGFVLILILRYWTPMVTNKFTLFREEIGSIFKSEYSRLEESLKLYLERLQQHKSCTSKVLAARATFIC
jgi:hypothetical protein